MTGDKTSNQQHETRPDPLLDDDLDEVQGGLEIADGKPKDRHGTGSGVPAPERWDPGEYSPSSN